MIAQRGTLRAAYVEVVVEIQTGRDQRAEVA
jgi:hypothetical protein